MPILTQDEPHGRQTRRSQFSYLFTAKHHGGDRGAAQWLRALTLDQEFQVFDTADEFDISDEDGRLYGVDRSEEGELNDLGTWQQQVAEFPVAAAEAPWHGYPIWPVNSEAPANRSGQRMRPSKAVFQKMERAGLISMRERKRLMKGNHV